VLGFRDRIKRHQNSQCPRISAATLKKRIGAVQAIMSFAHQERWIPENVAARIKISGYLSAGGGRRSFQDGELRVLFGAPLFCEPGGWRSRRGAVTDRTLAWLFLLGLTSGARLEEVGQARLDDIKRDGDILYIDVDDREFLGAPTPAGEIQKNLKNNSSRRLIPIHKYLTDLGLERYLASLRNLGITRLFPDLQPDKLMRHTKEASRRANRYIRRFVSTDERLVFHSLRHRFKDEGRAERVQDSVLDRLCGHTPMSTGGRYGDGINLKFLKSELDRLMFASVPWRELATIWARIDWDKEHTAPN